MTRSRGRPKRSDLPDLIVLGENSDDKIKCKICHRIFPKMKNLNTHISTHTDEKKYECDFPECTKKFKQSSQLKNHLLLHSKEKPFICPADGCLARYTHSGRICPSHSDLKLIKQPQTTEEIRSRFYRNLENLSDADKTWFEEYLCKRERKSPPAKKRKMDHLEGLLENHEGIMKGSDYEDSVLKGSDSEDSIMKNCDSEESIMKDCDSEESIMKDCDSEESIMKDCDSEESIMRDCDSEDSIMKDCDNDESIMKGSDNDESIMKGSDSEESIMKGCDSEESTIKGSDSEDNENFCEEIQQVFEGALLFYKFLEDLGKKGGNSKALFEKSCHAIIVPYS